MASPSRRSSRKKAKVSYDENVVKIHPDEEAEKPKRSRRPPPKKRHFSDTDDSSDDEGVARKPPPPKRRKSASNNNGRGPVSERTCPHCDQVCSSKAGLKYHVGTCENVRTEREPVIFSVVSHFILPIP